MFKILSAEVKKIVSKPGIYILSVLLAIVLVLGVFIYKPVVHEDSRFELKNSTFIEKYTDFIGDGSQNAGKQAQAQNDILNAINSINNYSVYYEKQNEYITQQKHVELLIKQFEDFYDAYRDCSSDNSSSSQINSTRTSLVNTLTSLNVSIENAFIKSHNSSYPILSSKDNYNLYITSYKQVYEWAKIAVEKENLVDHFVAYENKYKDNFYKSLNGFVYPTLSDDLIKTYTTDSEGTKLSILNERLTEIMNQIAEHLTLSQSDPTGYNIKNAHIMDELANKYVITANNYTEMIKLELINHAFTYLSTSEELNVMFLSDFSSYNTKSLLAKYRYIFDENKTSYDFANPLTIGVSSNNEINAYDYAYFVLKLFSFIIIIYSILASCHTIAGEVKEGSMRYLSIRPISRKEMFFGKWLSIILMSSILMLFSTVISLCVGNAVYGMSSATILTTFNGSIAFTIHPLGLIGIYLLSMLLELIVYSLIAMLFSVLFKSDLMSMTVLMVLYLLNLIVPIFVQGANSWLAYYPFSHMSLYSLFGSSVYASSNNFFNLVFGAKVYAGTHAALTISTIFIFAALAGFIAVRLFKKKEL